MVAWPLASVRWLRSPGFGAGRHGFPGYADAPNRMVSRHVLGHLSEELGQRTEPATGAWVGQLPDSVDLPTQVAEGHGPAWPGTAAGHRRGGRRAASRR